jgi:anti-sigma B factor antagonist
LSIARRFDPRLDIAVERRAGRVILKLEGEFDLSSEAQFQERLAELRDPELAELILDMRGLEFIDSSGLRLIIKLAGTARDEDFKLTLIPGEGQVESVLKTTGLDRILPMSSNGDLPAEGDGDLRQEGNK